MEYMPAQRRAETVEEGVVGGLVGSVLRNMR
jgi:hypothetical protein